MDFSEFHRTAVQHAFDPEKPFIATGSAHAAAYYPRNFAWCYPSLLDPVFIFDRSDGKNRCALPVRSLALMCRALRAGVHTTTLVPPTSRRIVGVNYFSKPSDSLLGVLAALNQLVTAEHYDEPSCADICAAAAEAGRAIGSVYHCDIAAAAEYLASDLEPYRAQARVPAL